MCSTQCKIKNLRDFLIHLPTIAGYEYNDVVRYIIWKVLGLSLKTAGELDWESFSNIFNSENWHNGTYKDILKDVSWKDKFQVSSGNDHTHAGTMCHRLCYPLETVYYCFTCTMNPLYEICEYCFDKTKHEGHIYTARIVVRQEGRVCHCGDTSIFKDTKYSKGCKTEANNGFSSGGSSESLTNYNESTTATLNTILDYLIDMTIFLKDQKETFLSATNTLKKKMQAEDDCFTKTLLEDSRGNISEEDENSSKWAVQIDEEDCNIHYMDLTAKIARTLNKPAEFAISLTSMLEKGCPSITVTKSFDLTKIQQISTSLQQEGVNNHVRSMRDIFKRDLVEDLIEWLYTLATEQTTDLKEKKALRLSMLDAWESGLQSTKFTPKLLSPYVVKLNLLGGFLVSYEQHDTFPWFKPWNFGKVDDPKVTHIMSNYDKRLADTNVLNTVSRFHPLHGSRFQYILVESTNFLSRLSRYRMLKVLSTLFTLTDPVRQCLAAQYFDIYLSVLYSTVASDNTGFKVSLMSIFSQYTFQHPDTANLAIQSSFIQRTLKFAFTLMAFTPDDLLAYLPIPLCHGCRLSNETIRNRRTIMCFKDICILMSTNTIPLELLQDNEITASIVESFSAFNNILPLKRETAEHVEFENFDFSSYYFYFSSILVMVDGFVRSISLINDKKSRKNVVTKLIKISMEHELELLVRFRKSISSPFLATVFIINQNKSCSLPIIREKICNYVADIINFQVGVDIQNFFNPMSYLFKFILQWSQCGRYVPFPNQMENYLDFDEIFNDEKKSLYMCESGLSTLVLLGQINVGFWVRNGTPITHQARMYTKYSMREFTYMSDIFNVQFSMSYANPNEFMVTYIARWGLKNWANGVPVGDYPHHDTTVAIINESILLLVQLLSEIKSLVVVSSVDGFEKTLKAEIVHALCFKNCTYSQIMDSIPEHITKHAAFDLYLEEYTNFTAPSGLTDHGIYSLKTKYIREIDPYYVGLSSSKRYEVEKNIRDSMATNMQMHFDDTFVPAKEVMDQIKRTPYARLYAISSTDTFGLFLKNTLDLINKFNYDNLLPIVVHLIHQCVVNNLDDFMKIFWREFAMVDTEFYYYNSIGSILYGILLKEIFTQVHGKIREIFRYLSETAPHIDIRSYLQEQADSFNEDILWSSNEMNATKDGKFERKKKLAKSRREKMLRDLAKQQLQFIENNSLMADEEYMKESSTESTDVEKTLGWEYPEESCVFCKMSHENDMFIYFSYQEDNICDHGVRFPDQEAYANLLKQRDEKGNFCLREIEEPMMDNIERRTGKTRQGGVLRTCGHGSHITCLGNHMKSIRAAHSQTTKNVPVAYGFGLMYCPLCNGLCNSFLPQLAKANSRSSEGFFFQDNANCEVIETQPLLLSTGIKAARIFEDLVRGSSLKKGRQFGALDVLFVNTVSNIELTMRSDSSGLFLNEVSSQKLLTLRLLNELILFLHQNAFHDFLSPKEAFTWQKSLAQEINADFLLIANEVLKPLNCKKSEEFIDSLSGIERIKHVTKGKIMQDMSVLAKELLKVQFYKECFGPNSLKTSSCKHFSSDDKKIEDEVVLITDLFIAVTGLFISGSNKHLDNIHRMRYQIHRLLKNSFLVFLRRFYIMFCVQYAVGTNPEPLTVSSSCINVLLRNLKLPNFTAFLKELREKYCSDGLESIMGPITSLSTGCIARKLDSISLTSSKPVQLINLPHSLSYFFTSEKENLMHKVLKDDIAICLFCGKECKLQKTVALHGYAHGPCSNHVKNECEVSSTYGVFLIIRSNAIYFSYGERGTFYSAPYLHRHGEPDQDFKYNTPVYLDEKRYEHLCNGIVLDNMIPHIVLRLTDGNSDLGGWETM